MGDLKVRQNVESDLMEFKELQRTLLLAIIV